MSNFRYKMVKKLGYYLGILIPLAIISPVRASVFSLAIGSLELGHFNQDFQTYTNSQSALAFVATKNGPLVSMSDPQYVSGIPFDLSPNIPLVPVVENPIPGGKSLLSQISLPELSSTVQSSSATTWDNLSYSVNLSSATALATQDLPIVVSGTGQSGFNSSFFLKQGETLSFDFQFNLTTKTDITQASTDISDSTQEDTLFFYTLPSDFLPDNNYISISYFPNLSVTTSSPSIQAGLLDLLSYSTPLQQNQISLSADGISQYIQMQETGNLKGKFTYYAAQDTIFTLLAYTSSQANAQSGIYNEVPEPSIFYGTVIVVIFLLLS
jgi:hypothetical protein